MSYSALQAMDRDAYYDMLVDEAYYICDHPSNEVTFLRQSAGHADVHFRQDYDGLLSRFVENLRLPASTCFSSAATARESIASAIAYKAQEITDWFFSDRYEFRDPADYDCFTACVRICPPSESIGHGFNAADLKDYNTSAMSIVLERDFSPDSLYGIKLVTAYPDILRMPKYTRESGFAETPEHIVNTRQIFRGSIDKLAFLCKYRYPDMRIGIVERRQGRMETGFVMHHKSPDKEFDFLFTESSETIHQRLPLIKRLTPSELGFVSEPAVRIFYDVRQIRDKLKKGLEIKPAGEKPRVGPDVERG